MTTILIYGIALCVIDIPAYFLLRDLEPFHGGIQIGLTLAGIGCLMCAMVNRSLDAKPEMCGLRLGRGTYCILAKSHSGPCSDDVAKHWGGQT